MDQHGATAERTVLEVEGLKTYFALDEGTLKAVDDVSFGVAESRTIGIIGESGCGKSVTAQSILRIVPEPGRIVEGSIRLLRRDSEPLELTALPADGREMLGVRGKNITMIFQEPMTSLSPVHTVGNQIVEAIRLHVTEDRTEAEERAATMLSRVGVPNARERLSSYPHELSGGLCQRAMIAMALSCNPTVLIADEPTTALDVSVQAQILELMRELQQQFGMAIVYISHNLAVVSEISQTVAVMYLGRIVERSARAEIFRRPLHPYTRKLLESIPRMDKPGGGRLATIKGTVPVPLDPPERCGFYDRCDQAMKGVCDRSVPPLTEVSPDHFVRCFLYGGKEEAQGE